MKYLQRNTIFFFKLKKSRILVILVTSLIDSNPFFRIWCFPSTIFLKILIDLLLSNPILRILIFKMFYIVQNRWKITFNSTRTLAVYIWCAHFILRFQILSLFLLKYYFISSPPFFPRRFNAVICLNHLLFY